MGWVWEFVCSDGADDVADGLGAEIGDVVLCDVVFDRIVEWAGHLAGGELESD